MTTTKLEKKCNEYIRNRLRAPPIPLVKKWGRQLKMKSADIDKISGEIALRHKIGIFPPTHLLFNKIFT